MANNERTIAEGKADAILKVSEATRQAQSDPLFFKLKVLEVEQGRIEKWDGRYPNYLMQLGDSQGSLNFLLEVPQLVAE